MTRLPMPQLFTPMLASPSPAAFDSKEYWFEVKWDGIRVLAFVEPDRTRLYSRTGREITAGYPEVASLHERLRVGNAVIDGEIFACTDDGVPSFELLQQRIGLTRPGDIRRAMSEISVQTVLFDVPFIDGEWVVDQAIEKRFDLLGRSIEFDDRVMSSEPIAEHGIAFFEAARQRGLEGIVAKALGSRYLPGRRSKSWLKIKVVHTLDCVVGGYKPGQGNRSNVFGSLILGLYENDALRFIGSVGTGFDSKTLRSVGDLLDDRGAESSPFADRVPIPGARWIRPELVCEVEYREMTSGVMLRAPSFKRMRFDVSPADCRVP